MKKIWIYATSEGAEPDVEFVSVHRHGADVFADYEVAKAHVVQQARQFAEAYLPNTAKTTSNEHPEGFEMVVETEGREGHEGSTFRFECVLAYLSA